MEAYVGEIRMFAGNYAPVGWLKCDGAVLGISEYQALYSLIGTTYGGNGSTNFALPNLCGRIPVGQGQGAGLQNYTVGQFSGTETVALDGNSMPAHSHSVSAATTAATEVTPSNTVILAATASPIKNFLKTLPTPQVARILDNSTVGFAGGQGGVAVPHNNMMPSFALTFIICNAGIYPSRN